MPVLEFIGKDTARRNYAKFLKELEQDYPNLSQEGRNELAMAYLTRVQPRSDRHTHILFGPDVETETPEQMPWWPLLSRAGRRMVKERTAPQDPPGLSQTYVWCARGGWVQDVTEVDAKIILASPIRNWFQRAELGPFVPKDPFDVHVVSSGTLSSISEAKRFQGDMIRKPQWNGV